MTPPTLSTFFSHVWERAKAELRELDPEFVSALEDEVQLNKEGLVAPSSATSEARPKRRLPGKWHQLLEACVELEIQADCLETASALLRPHSSENGAIAEAGRGAIHNWRSWFVHASALAEKAEVVILKTIALHPGASRSMQKRFRQRVKDEITQYVTSQRQDYVHGRRSWAAGFTEDQLWERTVAEGLTPEMFFRDFYPAEGKKQQSDPYRFLAERANQFIANLGVVLHELEVQIALHVKSDP